MQVLLLPEFDRLCRCAASPVRLEFVSKRVTGGCANNWSVKVEKVADGRRVCGWRVCYSRCTRLLYVETPVVGRRG